MIKHIVMYKLKDSTKENALQLQQAFLSMKGKIEQVVSLEAGVDILNSERSFDVVLECTFKNLEDMSAYKKHPVHLPVQKYVHSVIEKSQSVDYEF
ncbi:MAG: Dabb family protein [Clostridia bacterium]